MSHSLAFELNAVLGSNALKDMLKVSPFGIPTSLFDGWPVDLAPPLGLIKLLVAPESNISLLMAKLLSEDTAQKSD